jgi:hypothetical protein
MLDFVSRWFSVTYAERTPTGSQRCKSLIFNELQRGRILAGAMRPVQSDGEQLAPALGQSAVDAVWPTLAYVSI